MRVRRPLLAAVLAVLGAVVPVLVVAPVQAADPVPTSTQLIMTGAAGTGQAGTITLTATVSSAAGTPTGSVTFTGTMPTKTVPLGANGKAIASVQTDGLSDVEFTAAFTGTNGFADSVSDQVYAIAPDRTLWYPEPTVARLGPDLRLTLTFATRITDKAGAPKVGVPIHFSLFAPIPAFLEDPKGVLAIEICAATTDANGFATCKGKALLGSVVSILAGGAYATEYAGFFPTASHTRLPVFAFG